MLGWMRNLHRSTADDAGQDLMRIRIADRPGVVSQREECSGLAYRKTGHDELGAASRRKIKLSLVDRRLQRNAVHREHLQLLRSGSELDLQGHKGLCGSVDHSPELRLSVLNADDRRRRQREVAGWKLIVSSLGPGSQESGFWNCWRMTSTRSGRPCVPCRLPSMMIAPAAPPSTCVVVLPWTCG